MNTKDFIGRARSVHGDAYAYDEVDYVNSRTKVTVSCNKCGTRIVQTPSSHLQGRGCLVCRDKDI
jgi:hypothetical protein